MLDGSLVKAGKGRRGRDVKRKMVPEFVGCEGKKLTLNGYVCKFYIRTDPFSEAFLKKPENEILKKSKGITKKKLVETRTERNV